jgi:hypothetical protein
MFLALVDYAFRRRASHTNTSVKAEAWLVGGGERYRIDVHRIWASGTVRLQLFRIG